jgi:hypothetical protein
MKMIEPPDRSAVSASWPSPGTERGAETDNNQECLKERLGKLVKHKPVPQKRGEIRDPARARANRLRGNLTPADRASGAEARSYPVGRYEAVSAQPAGVWVLDPKTGSLRLCATNVRPGQSADIETIAIACMLPAKAGS